MVKRDAASKVIEDLDGLRLDDLDELDEESLRKMEGLLHHWQQLCQKRLEKMSDF